MEEILENYINGSPTGQDKLRDTLLANDAQTIFNKLMKVRGDHERTVIHTAAQKGDTDTLHRIHQKLSEENWCKLLEEKDARNGDTALHLAAANGHPDTVSYILYESQIEEKAWRKLLLMSNKDGYTPVHCAVRREDSKNEFNAICPVNQPQKLDAWFEVLKVKSNEGNTAVHEAARNGDLIKLQTMIEKLPEVSKRRLLRMRNDNGHSAFHRAIDCRHPLIVDYICNNENYSVDTKSKAELLAKPTVKAADDSPEAAADSPEVQNLKNYINGLPANPDITLSQMTGLFEKLKAIRGDDGYTAIHSAVLMGDDFILEAYHKELSRPEWYELLKIQDARNGDTALHLAATNGHPDTVSYILYDSVGDKKVRMELLKIQNKAGDTPVHCAVRRGVFGEFDEIFPDGSVDTVKTWPSVLQVENNEGYTAVQEAARNGDTEKQDTMLAFLPEKK